MAAHTLKTTACDRHPSRLGYAEHLRVTALGTMPPGKESSLSVVSDHSPSDVLSFWREAGEGRWWTKDDAFDADICARFMPLWQDAASGKCDHWTGTDDGTLALVIVLDQFPRNMFRNDPRAFSTDVKACGIAHAAIASGVDCRVADDLRQFLYLPLMHSEQLADQETCVNLVAQLENEKNTQFALIHADIIRKFGRFPHRNPVLGRTTTPDEQAFLDSGGFSG